MALRSSASAAAAARPAQAAGRGGARDDDRRGLLAAQLLEPLHRARERLLRELAEFRDRVVEGRGLDLEAQRQRAGGREDLGLSDVQHGPRGVRRAGGRDRSQPLQRADAPIREGLLAVEGRAVHCDVGVVEIVCCCHGRILVVDVDRGAAAAA